MKQQILAILLSDAPWQYYNKFELYLKQLKHPFRHRIVFYRDYDMAINESTLLQYGAVAFFYHDPLEILYPAVYRYAKHLESICKRAGIPFINKPDALSNTIKSVQLNKLRAAGFTVAEAFPFEEVGELAVVPASAYPLFIRIDAGHDSQGVFIQGPFYTFTELKAAYKPFELEGKTHHRGSVALQWIDTAKTDGYFRKYRCLATKHDVIKGYTYFSEHWYIHGGVAIKNAYAAEANTQYTRTPMLPAEKAFFLKANEALDFDFSAYDYAYKSNGDIVIWEANPHPAFLSMTDAEPVRSRVVALLVAYYESFLPPLPWQQKIKQGFNAFLR